MDITNQNLAILTQAFNAAFMQGLGGGTPPEWMQIATEVPSKTSEEKYGWLADTFTIREWLGERRIQALRAADYSIKNKTFEGTVGVPVETIEDDQFGTYGARFTMMGDETKRFPDVLTYALLQAGFSTTCFDGQYFFDTDHPVGLPGKEVSVSNNQGGSGTAWYLLDTSRFIKPLLVQKRRAFKLVMKDKPTDDNVFDRNEFIYGVDGRMNVGYGFWQFAYASKQTLSDTNFEAAKAAMMNFKKDNGAPIGVKPTILLVPPSLESTAKKLIEAETLANGASNTNRNTVKVVASAYLAA
jgi:phage major head subunit gpT-like protein